MIWMLKLEPFVVFTKNAGFPQVIFEFLQPQERNYAERTKYHSDDAKGFHRGSPSVVLTADSNLLPIHARF